MSPLDIIGRIVRADGTSYHLHRNGYISGEHVSPSGGWVVSGAVRYNNFGKEVEVIGAGELLAGKLNGKDAWRYKNGKQKWHVIDNDHNTRRVWMSPDHYVWIDTRWLTQSEPCGTMQYMVTGM